MSAPKERELTDADYRRLAAFRLALRRFMHFSVDAARAAGLTTHQHQALLAIRASRPEPMTVGQLADQLFIAPHTAAELTTRLVEAGYIRKVEDKTDRRRIALALTRKAEGALRRLSLVHLRELGALSPQLQRILGDLNEKLDGSPPDEVSRT